MFGVFLSSSTGASLDISTLRTGLEVRDDVVVFSNPLTDGHFRRYHLQIVFHMKLSVLKPILGYIHLLTSPKVRSFPLRLQP